MKRFKGKIRVTSFKKERSSAIVAHLQDYFTMDEMFISDTKILAENDVNNNCFMVNENTYHNDLESIANKIDDVIYRLNDEGETLHIFMSFLELDHFNSLTGMPIEFTFGSEPDSVIPSTLPSNGMPINDHTCPTCKNNRCSKSEVKCWRCGGNL